MSSDQLSSLAIISKKRENLISILRQPPQYMEIYRDILSKANPNWVESFLGKIELSGIAARRRLNRLEKNFEKIKLKEKKATQILKDVIDRAGNLHEESATDNKLHIGNIVRLEEELTIQRVVVEAVIKECKDTIEFVSNRLKIRMPEEYLDWTNLNFDPAYVSSEFSIIERVQHQERWSRMMSEIQREKTIASNLRASEAIRTFSFLSEQICSRLTAEATREIGFMMARFRALRTAVELGEIAKIDNFFKEKIGGGESLDDVESNFKRLAGRIDEEGGTNQ